MNPAEAPAHTDYRALADRLGADYLRVRIHKQALLWTRDLCQGVGLWSLEGHIPMDRLIHGFLRLAGVAEAGRRNYLDVRIVRNPVRLRNLPRAFEGYRLLQIADLHCDLEEALIDRVIGRLREVEYDAVVLTGDYQNKIGQNSDRALELMGRLIAELRGIRAGILGNHDFIEKVVYLERAGLPLLLNEKLALEKEGARIWLCGVDDPHFFKTADLARAREGIPKDDVAILLSHSPEPYPLAEELHYSLMLSGHTHGGQICLPGGIPIIRNSRVPRRMLAGPWRHGSLAGYTSRGTGGCQVAARFFCPPEITLHVLGAAESG